MKKAEDLISWFQVSEHLTGNGFAIRKRKYSSLYAIPISELLTMIQQWMKSNNVKMKPQIRITRLAGELIAANSFGWLQKHLGMNSQQLKRAMAQHCWTCDQATVINGYHELLIDQES